MGSSLEKFKESKFYEGEEVISSIEVYIGKLMGFGENTQYNGELILTRQQLIFYAEAMKPNPEVYERIPLHQIASMDIAGWLQKTLTIVSNNDVYDFKSLGPLEEMEFFKQKISFTRDNMIATEETEPNSLKSKKSNIDMNKIEEIEKLKKLLDAGALSKEQYDLLLNDIIGDNVKKLTKEEQLLADGAITQEQYDILTKQSDNSLPSPAPNSTATPPSRQSHTHQTSEKYTLIGKTKWLNNCLSVTKYANGNKIPEIYSVQKMEEICNNESGGYFSKRFPMTNYQLDTYGGNGFLYSKNDLLELIPKGYRIPNSIEWAELFTELGMNKTKENWHDAGIIWNEFESANGIRNSFFKEQGFVCIDETGGGLFSKPKRTINIYNDAVAYAMWTRMNALVDGEIDEGYALLAIGIDNNGNTILLPNPEAIFVKLVIDETES